VAPISDRQEIAVSEQQTESTPTDEQTVDETTDPQADPWGKSYDEAPPNVKVPNVTAGAQSGLAHEVIGSAQSDRYDDAQAAQDGPQDASSTPDGGTPADGTEGAQTADSGSESTGTTNAGDTGETSDGQTGTVPPA
jgi:hypothetical protein